MSLDIYLNCEHCGTEIFSSNYTHNVTPMWSKAGCYQALYESEDKRAEEIVTALEAAVRNMADNPQEYITLNPPNGWGSYETALPWLREFLNECKRHPKAIIGVSR